MATDFLFLFLRLINKLNKNDQRRAGEIPLSGVVEPYYKGLRLLLTSGRHVFVQRVGKFHSRNHVPLFPFFLTKK